MKKERKLNVFEDVFLFLFDISGRMGGCFEGPLWSASVRMTQPGDVPFPGAFRLRNMVFSQPPLRGGERWRRGGGGGGGEGKEGKKKVRKRRRKRGRRTGRMSRRRRERKKWKSWRWRRRRKRRRGRKRGRRRRRGRRKGRKRKRRRRRGRRTGRKKEGKEEKERGGEGKVNTSISFGQVQLHIWIILSFQTTLFFLLYGQGMLVDLLLFLTQFLSSKSCAKSLLV